MKPKKESLHMDKQEKWKQLYEQGLSFTQIGQQEGVHYKTVQTVLKDVVQPRPKQTFAHLAKKWAKLYTVNELSIHEIAKQDQTSSATVSKYLKQEGVELRGKGPSSPLIQFLPEWVEQYEQGKTLEDIANQYGVSPQAVHKHLHNKVKMRAYTETSQVYPISNLHYLDAIDSLQKAYWLGVWYGTGFVNQTVGGYECTLVVSQKDQQTLKRFQAQIGYSKPLNYQSTGILSERTSVKLRIHSKHLYHVMLSHGLVTDKTNRLQFPLWLQDTFIPAFVLGYYEGKGYFSVKKNSIKGVTYTQPYLELYGNKSFLTDMKRVIEKQVPVTLRLRQTKDKGSATPEAKTSTITSLVIGNKQGINHMVNWLYQPSVECSQERDIRRLLVQNHKPV